MFTPPLIAQPNPASVQGDAARGIPWNPAIVGATGRPGRALLGG
jgi:hypothetical protein